MTELINVVPFVREGLGNSSYLVRVADEEAALIDPDRCIDRYLETARSRGWRVGSIFETHIHADFVSGALEAAHATGAAVYLPGEAQARFPHTPLKPGDRIRLGTVMVEPNESPGHTRNT